MIKVIHKNRSVSKVIVFFFTIFSLSTLFSACAPRGENNSLDEVLSVQQSSFRNALSSAQLSPELSKTIAGLEGKLKELLASAASTEASSKASLIVEDLSQLLNHAGYTSRPAMNELLNQFRVLADTKSAQNQSGSAIKLLVARTYSLLSAELTGVGFAVS
jgi:hypothetical protein